MDSKMAFDTIFYLSITLPLAQYFQLKDCSNEYINMTMTTLKPFSF